MKVLVFFIVVVKSSFACQKIFGYYPFDPRSKFNEDFEYWPEPKIRPSEATEEAVMLIGGRRCSGLKCDFLFSRRDNALNDSKPKVQKAVLPQLDRTIKFFTMYGGMCYDEDNAYEERKTPFLPRLPLPLVDAGAVALEDGRVVICGGKSVELLPGGRYGLYNKTVCYYWVHGTAEIKPMRYFNKLNFDWPGPLTPKLMQTARFFNGSDERILLMPWPRYSDYTTIGDKALKGGYIAVGKSAKESYGPRTKWEKLQLGSMALAHGGCYVLETINETRIRVHTFGGRELGLNYFQEDAGWTKNGRDLNKHHRYFDLGLEAVDGDVFLAQDVKRSECVEPVEVTNETFGERLNKKIKAEEKCVKLDEDRLYATCHLLAKSKIVLVGGGETGRFFDRPGFEKEAERLYKTFALFELGAKTSNCAIGALGCFVQKDVEFGYGLNYGRARHASEVVKRLDLLNDDRVLEDLFVFGGFGDRVNSFGDGEFERVLDNIESQTLGSRFNFYPYANSKRELFRYRLPWPLMDITSVKIPVEWLPPKCLKMYKERRYQFQLLEKYVAENKVPYPNWFTNDPVPDPEATAKQLCEIHPLFCRK